MGKIKTKSIFTGGDCIVRGIELILLFFWPIRTFVGVVALIIGGGMPLKYVCSECGSRGRQSSSAKLCPVCGEHLTASWNC